MIKPMTSLGDRDRKSVAILPFKNVGNDREIDFYQFSLADAVITELRVRSLVVRPSSVIVKYQNRLLTPLKPDAISASTRSYRDFPARRRSIARYRATTRRRKRDSLERAHRCRRQRHHRRAGHIVQRIVEGLRLELRPDEKDELARKQRPTPPPLKSTCAAAIAWQRSSTTPSSASISTPPSNTSAARSKSIPTSHSPIQRLAVVTSIAC